MLEVNPEFLQRRKIREEKCLSSTVRSHLIGCQIEYRLHQRCTGKQRQLQEKQLSSLALPHNVGLGAPFWTLRELRKILNICSYSFISVFLLQNSTPVRKLSAPR